jgi:hypothetical protein
VAGWYTIPVSSTVCDYNAIATQARQAATANGHNLAAYSRLVYAFPNNACGWWGLGSVGGNPSQAWINGSLQLRVAGHEMGHNLGLYHAHALECGAAVLGTGCSSIEYGDPLDIMGSSSGHFSAYQKERLGWLNYGSQPPITTVQADGTYSIDAYEPAGADPKALKILQYTNPANGRKTWFYIEARQAIGFDSFLSSNANVLNGVVLHLGTESTPDSSYLLDLTPATSSWSDPGLVVGLSFSDPDSGVTITPASVGPSGASVNVTFGPVPCVRGVPSVSLSPSQSQWVPPGTRVTYTVTLANTDNAGCAATSFTLGAGVPGGWTAAFASPALMLSPGASGSTTLEVTSPQTGAADGFYTFPVGATNSVETAYAGAASATYVIVSSLSVSVSTDRASYRRNQTVTMTATVSSLGSPVAGASVTFTVTRPNGSRVTGTATTDSSGRAVWTHRIKKQDPLGNYGVSAQASLSGSVLGAGSTSFAVQ